MLACGNCGSGITGTVASMPISEKCLNLVYATGGGVKSVGFSLYGFFARVFSVVGGAFCAIANKLHLQGAFSYIKLSALRVTAVISGVVTRIISYPVSVVVAHHSFFLGMLVGAGIVLVIGAIAYLAKSSSEPAAVPAAP